MLSLIDTHTHFDVADFDADRLQLSQLAYERGVKAIVLIGFLAKRFNTLLQVQQQINQATTPHPMALLAPGLHPYYIHQHTELHLDQLEQLINHHKVVAIGEIGIDTFTKDMKKPEILARQQKFFSAQLELAQQYDLPVLLHIRRAHAETLAVLKKHRFKQGGIAHAFGGGVQEARAFINMGFKLGVTGQVTNPNAKRLHDVIKTVGAAHLVLETDCPDMTPLCCQQSNEHRTRNTPANLPFVLAGLSQVLNINQEELATQLWQNSLSALSLSSDLRFN